MPERAPPPESLGGLDLDRIAALAAAAPHPPVAAWHPAQCGDSGMRIATDGTWYHHGDPIRRDALVRLFASILRREPDGSYVLVTPAEKLTIAVDDVPFVAVELASESTGRGRRLAFRLNTGALVVAGAATPIRVAEGPEGPRPYLHVRDGLEARLARPVYYELAELALAEGHEPPGLWSDGAFLALGPA